MKILMENKLKFYVDLQLLLTKQSFQSACYLGHILVPKFFSLEFSGAVFQFPSVLTLSR